MKKPKQLDIEDAIKESKTEKKEKIKRALLAEAKASAKGQVAAKVADKKEPVKVFDPVLVGTGKKKAGLAEAFAGWPKSNKDRYHLYFYKWGTNEFQCNHKFSACYAAKKFLEACAVGLAVEVRENGSIDIGERWNVRNPEEYRNGKEIVAVAEIWEHKYTKDEEAWVLPVPYDGYAAALAGQASPMTKRVMEAAAEGKTARLPKSEMTHKGAKKAAKAEAGDKPKRTRSSGGSDPFAIRDGMPYDHKVRRLAKKMAMDKTGSVDGWKAYKATAIKQLKEMEK